VSDEQRRRAERFRALHAGEPFVIPNPWDAGSARVLERLGFPALATTSSGFAFTLGRPDGGASLDEIAAHVEAITGATELPLSVDLEHGHGPVPADAAAAIACVAQAGAVGGSIEDWDPEAEVLDPVDAALERLRAARDAADALGFPFTLTARAENHIRGNPDLDDTIVRLQAYEQAGADVVYAPGLRDVAEVARVCRAVSCPVNVLAWRGASAAELFEAGAQRISVGGSLAWAAYDALRDAAKQIARDGDFGALGSPAALRASVAR
jgi:2-methylisocitrate lyase-like PEP mutase family enzyme